MPEVYRTIWIFQGISILKIDAQNSDTFRYFRLEYFDIELFEYHKYVLMSAQSQTKQSRV